MLNRFRKLYPDNSKFISLMYPYRKKLALFFAISAVSILLWLLFPLLTKKLIDNVLIQKDYDLLYPVLLSTFAVAFFGSLLNFFKNYYISYIQHAMATQMNFDMCRHVFRMSFSFWDEHEAAELLSRLRDASTSRRVLIRTISAIFNNMVYIVFVPAILFFMNWKLSLLVLSILPLVAASFVLFSKPVKRYSRTSAQMRGQISAQYQETFSGIREIKALGNEGLVFQRLKRSYLRFRKTDMIMRVYGELQGFFAAVIRAVGTLLYTAFGAHLVIDGQMTIGELMAFTTFIGYLYTPLASLAGLLVPIQEVLVHTQRFNEIYELQPSILSPVKSAKETDYHKDIVFRNVGFCFKDAQPVLSGIDLRIKGGTTTAVVGRTGSGKSTLLSLIPRFYDPVHGAILIDGINIHTLDLKRLCRNIAFVMQKPFMFNGTIRDNLTGGSYAFSMENIIDACRTARAYDFISTLPEGFDTVVGENGVTLSGGEIQRIALSRALLSNRPILIMDEPTTGIDQETEAQIYAAIRELSGSKTTIIISHNLDSIKFADNIIVVANGAVVETGNHDALLHKGGEYCRLYLNQRMVKPETCVANEDRSIAALPLN